MVAGRLFVLSVAMLAGALPASAASPQAERFVQIVDGSLPAPRAWPDDAWVSLQRTACFGGCPAYTVRVDGAGRVEFRGRGFVCAKGLRRARIPRAAAQRLITAVDDAGFATMSDYDRRDWTDAPSNLLQAELGAGVHQVRHYDGMKDVPELVDAIEDAIDRVAQDARWLPSAGQPGTCTRRDGSRYTFDMRGRIQSLR